MGIDVMNASQLNLLFDEFEQLSVVFELLLLQSVLSLVGDQLLGIILDLPYNCPNLVVIQT